MNQRKITISVKNIHKMFGSKVVHSGISFDLYDQELIGLFGGSGSGKSIILRSIIGLETPDSGSIVFEGDDLTKRSERELTEARKQIAYVFQNGALFDSLTVQENLAYPLQEHTNLSDKEIEDRVNKMLELIDMTGSNNLLPAELSGGMQKRAGLARATIMNPQVILFDEPTAGLDPVNTKRLLTNIKQLKKRGLTGIFVTHDIPSAIEICDRIAILKDGKIAIIEKTEEILKSKDPLVTSFTEGFIIKQ